MCCKIPNVVLENKLNSCKLFRCIEIISNNAVTIASHLEKFRIPFCDLCWPTLDQPQPDVVTIKNLRLRTFGTNFLSNLVEIDEPILRRINM